MENQPETVEKPSETAQETPRLPWRRPDHSTAVILNVRGDAETQSVRAPLIEAATGSYHAEVRARYWLRRPIPAGWLTVFVENNPVAVTERPPGDFTAKELAILTGDFPTHTIGGAFKGRNAPLTWGRAVLIFAAVVIALGVAGLFWAHRRGLL